MVIARSVLGGLAALALTLPAPAGTAPAEHFFIPCADGPVGTDVRHSFVFDGLRGQLLIAQPMGGVRRFDMATRSFLADWSVGTRLRAIDITQDGSRVVLAEETTLPGAGDRQIGRIHVIDAQTGSASQITWQTDYFASNGAGAYDVAVASNNKVLVTPAVPNLSAWERLREIDLDTGQVRSRTDMPIGDTIELGSGVSRNSTGSHLLIWRGGGRHDAFVYSAATGSFGPNAPRLGYGEISPDGQRVAAYQFASIFDPAETGVLTDINFDLITQLPGSTLTYTFDPVRPLIYYADRGTHEFVTLSALDGSVLSRLSTGDNFDSALHLTISPDGQWAFVQVENGVRAIQIPGPATALILLAPLTLRRRARSCHHI